eukprot:CAMPEP_0173107308 /NCGR_PEP_ID=MMETSP1102-20130122/41708_1 /TAXON_ID=49646 /ORGANISM="Geminigera sp., Strain Caron Lab Isolate" /LENGTH=75 /DNA_ID=CAMNT_0014004889 /DNA_START=2391 /DNA_END=2618 /DNA_ORIENTATION=-
MRLLHPVILSRVVVQCKLEDAQPQIILGAPFVNAQINADELECCELEVNGIEPSSPPSACAFRALLKLALGLFNT